MKRSRREFLRTLGTAAAGSIFASSAGSAAAGGKESLRGGAETGPARLALYPGGGLRERGEALLEMKRGCRLCPRECGATRLDGERGFCGASGTLEISSHHAHFGEERPLVGSGGSGTIFMTHCPLRCVFCINWEISHGGEGSSRSIGDLAEMMLELQGKGCSNINVVTPTHYAAEIVLALDRATGRGLTLPLVWNTCGWEKIEVLELLDGVVDIYLPDYKYSSGAEAGRYSAGARSYPEVTERALLEMNRQVGAAHPDGNGIMRRGLMIRHLVMPNGVSGTEGVIGWIAKNLPKDTYLNLMSQYTPAYRAGDYPEISRRLTREEFENAVRLAERAGLTNLDIQPMPRF